MVRYRYTPEDELRDAITPLIAMGCDERQLSAFALLLITITPGLEAPRVKQMLMELDAMRKDITKINDAAQALDRINSHHWIGPNGIRFRRNWIRAIHCCRRYQQITRRYWRWFAL
jgi:hypothetical protein